MSSEHHSVTIIGSGISGLSAAIYAGRAGNEPLVIKGGEPGGQLTLTTDVANYPGFPDGISGPELIHRMTQQAESFGATLRNATVERIDDSDRPFEIVLETGESFTSEAVIVASGASARTLGVPGEDELMGYGVSTCATCDGAFFRDDEMIVVGGGDAALEEATFLTKFASTVYIVHRREEFRAEQIWQDTVQEKVDDGEIELLLNTEVAEIVGDVESGVNHVRLVTHPDGKPTTKLDDPDIDECELDVEAAFVAIGHTPNTSFLEGTSAELDDDGYVRLESVRGGNQTEIVPGLYAAGDVVDYHYQQAATAGGMGVKAALDADAYLRQ